MTDTVSIIAKAARTEADAARLGAGSHGEACPAATGGVTHPDHVSLQTGRASEVLTVVPLVAEDAVVSKRAVVTGRVSVRTLTEVFEELVREELASENVSVTRVPVDRIIETAPSVRTEGDVTIIPILEEVLVIEKRLLLKEEVHVRRQHSREQVEQTVTLRKQRAVVERVSSDGVRVEDEGEVHGLT